MRKFIIGMDLHMERPSLCFYEPDTRKSGMIPMRIGNAEVNISELFAKADYLTDKAVARTIADILKEVFRTFGVRVIDQEIAGLMVTVRDLNKPMVDMLRSVFDMLGISRGSAYIQDYRESFYYYMVYQNKELWGRNAALFDFDGNEVTYYRLAVSDNSRPRKVRVICGGSCVLEEDKEARDARFLSFADEQLRNELFSSIFITGEGFDPAWAEESGRLLCKGRRKVFTEDDLFARGARNAARERADERRIRGIAYAGDSLVHYDIGMNMQQGDKTVYYPMVSAGVHWYNASCDCEFLLGDEKKIALIVTSAQSGGRYQSVIALDGLPDRPERTTRLQLHIDFESADRCLIEVRDLGFGELFPSSGLVWKEELGEVK